MDVQRAIHILQDCGDAAKGTEFEQVFRMGAAALQEQAERKKGCKVCNKGVDIIYSPADDLYPYGAEFCPHCGAHIKNGKDDGHE